MTASLNLRLVMDRHMKIPGIAPMKPASPGSEQTVPEYLCLHPNSRHVLFSSAGESFCRKDMQFDQLSTRARHSHADIAPPSLSNGDTVSSW